MTSNLSLKADVFNVYGSVWMHTADLELHHPPLWCSPQNFYTCGEPEKQVKHDLIKTNEEWSARVSADWLCIARASIGGETQLGPSNRGSRVAYRKCHRFFFLPALGKTAKNCQREQLLIWSSFSRSGKTRQIWMFCVCNNSQMYLG